MFLGPTPPHRGVPVACAWRRCRNSAAVARSRADRDHQSVPALPRYGSRSGGPGEAQFSGAVPRGYQTGAKEKGRLSVDPCGAKGIRTPDLLIANGIRPCEGPVLRRAEGWQRPRNCMRCSAGATWGQPSRRALPAWETGPAERGRGFYALTLCPLRTRRGLFRPSGWARIPGHCSFPLAVLGSLRERIRPAMYRQ